MFLKEKQFCDTLDLHPGHVTLVIKKASQAFWISLTRRTPKVELSVMHWYVIQQVSQGYQDGRRGARGALILFALVFLRLRNIIHMIVYITCPIVTSLPDTGGEHTIANYKVRTSLRGLYIDWKLSSLQHSIASILCIISKLFLFVAGQSIITPHKTMFTLICIYPKGLNYGSIPLTASPCGSTVNAGQQHS